VSAPKPVLELRLGDRLALRKAHPCGSTSWQVTRLGADIGLLCDGCGRRVMLERAELERRLASLLERGPADQPSPDGVATP
jgi:hypothetical protein